MSSASTSMRSIIDRAKELPGCEAVEFHPNGLYRLISEDFSDGSDDDDLPPIKREADTKDNELPRKRQKVCARKLLWEDFASWIVSELVLQSSECYQYALQVKLEGVRPRPSGQSQQRTTPHVVEINLSQGSSFAQPIEIG